ncbi:MAG: DUF4097 family beta strand repeat protein [Alicyclobacillaceae bacterium]|nr:DUF4097 family beta strand repeat protein [Alicyclobacillaceae bacterium]
MRTSSIGILTSALTFIAIGVVIVLHVMGLVSFGVLKYLWPILLIAFGIEMIWGYLTHRGRLSVWSLVLIVLVALLSIVESAAPWRRLPLYFGPSYLVPVNGHVHVGGGVKKVRIEVTNAQVTVTGTTGSEVAYDGKLDVGASSQSEAERQIESRWSVHRVGDVLEMRLDAAAPFGFRWAWTDMRPYLNVQVPNALSAEVVISNGSVQVAQLQASSDVHTNNGAIDVEDIRGDVNVTTNNGAVSLKHITGRVDAHTTNGMIRGASQIGGDWTCSTTNGAIQLTVPPGTNATVDAHTGNGSIGGDVSWTFDSRQHGKSVLGSGDYHVYLSTTNGRIAVDENQ